MKEKEDILRELKRLKKVLGKSPGRRNMPSKLYWDCYRHFRYLNEAKKSAGLTIHRRRCKLLSENSKRYTLELVRIIAYLTGDRHLHKDMKAFLHSSKDMKSLKDFDRCVKEQFGISVSKIEKSAMNRYGECTQYRYFNTAVAKFLYSIGTPKGDKADSIFKIPLWIRNNKQFIREYLKVLFYCEGCKYKAKGSKRFRIQINMRKTIDFMEDGKDYMESLREALKKSSKIKTNRLSLTEGKKRNKDGKRTIDLRFGIKASSVDRFIKEIGWLK